jgi:hypothetical protein
MSIPVSALAALALSIAPAVQAANTKAIEATCHKAGIEDHVTADDLDHYIELCLQEALQRRADHQDLPPDGDADAIPIGELEYAPEGDQEPAPLD